MSEINVDDYKAVQTAMVGAEESNRPFIVPTDSDEIVVAGDVNETETVLHTFSVTFRVPQNTEDGVKETLKTIEYRDIFITPRQDLKIVKLIGELMPFFKKKNENSETELLSDEEIIALITSLPDELVDRMYNLVVEICGIDSKLKDYIEFSSAVAVLVEFFRDVPRDSE